MIVHSDLHRIRTGEATPQEARTAIRRLIAAEGAHAAPSIYTALRAWTWKALQTRRFDSEMEDWFRVIEATSAALHEKDQATSHYVEALSHLVDESLRFGAANTPEQLIGRSHVLDLLETIQRHNGRLGREQLREMSGLSSSRLSQLTRPLEIFGALGREMDGRNVTFLLTNRGVELIEQGRRARTAALLATHAEHPADHVFKSFYASNVARPQLREFRKAAHIWRDEPKVEKRFRFIRLHPGGGEPANDELFPSPPLPLPLTVNADEVFQRAKRT